MKVVNRRARFDYTIEDTFEAGIVLTGPEVKSVREGRIDLSESFARVRSGEAWLMNAYIPPYMPAKGMDYDPRRTRKLLLHKRQIQTIQGRQSGKTLTLVSLSCYTTRNLIKIELGLGRGKKVFEKREALKQRDRQRQLEEDLREKLS